MTRADFDHLSALDAHLHLPEEPTRRLKEASSLKHTFGNCLSVNSDSNAALQDVFRFNSASVRRTVLRKLLNIVQSASSTGLDNLNLLLFSQLF